MNRPSRVWSALALSFVAAMGTGADCGLDVPNTLSAEAKGVANDTAESEPSLAAGAAISILPALALTGEVVTLADAVAAQMNLPSLLLEPDCATVETDGNVVTYTLTDCTGPWGLLSVSGKEVATFSSVDAGAFQIDLASEGLTVNGAEATHGGTLRIDVEPDGFKSIEWTGAYAGVTKAGRDVDISTDVDVLVKLDDSSLTLNGTATADIGLRGLEIEFHDFERRADRCPVGEIVVTTKVTRLTLTLTYDGTQTVFVESDRGGRGTIDLTCTPAAGD